MEDWMIWSLFVLAHISGACWYKLYVDWMLNKHGFPWKVVTGKINPKEF